LSGRIRVLVVDDSSFMRKALSREIESDLRFAVVGTACNGEEGVQKALELQPDVITLDIEMPVLGGLETLQQLSVKSPAAVVMVSGVTESGAKTALDALALGAIDFIPKSQGLHLLHEKLAAAASVRHGQARGRTQASISAAELDALQSLPKGFSAKAVVIGSSTGGPQALSEILTKLANPLPVPVFIAQHMPAVFTAALARRLKLRSGHNVIEAEDGGTIVSGTVYIAPGGLQTRVADGILSVRREAGESVYQPSAGVLAESVFKVYGKCVLAIMLTGLGRDGAKEFARLRHAGAWTIAQDSASCAVFGMPKALIELGGACEVIPLKSMAKRIGEVLANNTAHKA
jgi:two-component system chemotaxis response regulator CheB